MELKYVCENKFGDQLESIMAGTGLLQWQISKEEFVIITVAHNFIQFEEITGKKVAKNA